MGVVGVKVAVQPPRTLSDIGCKFTLMSRTFSEETKPSASNQFTDILQKHRAEIAEILTFIFSYFPG